MEQKELERDNVVGERKGTNRIEIVSRDKWSVREGREIMKQKELECERRNWEIMDGIKKRQYTITAGSLASLYFQ